MLRFLTKLFGGRVLDLKWDPTKTSSYLKIENQGATLAWSEPVEAAWLCSATTARLSRGHFYWEFRIEGLGGHQLGVGILCEPVDWGFFSYLGAGVNAWAYDPAEGALVTQKEAIYSGLPRLQDSGVVAIDLDLLSTFTCTFVVNGVSLPPIPLAANTTVIPAATLLKVGQRVTLAGFDPKRANLAPLDRATIAARVADFNELVALRLGDPERRRAGRARHVASGVDACEAEIQKHPQDLPLLVQRAALLQQLDDAGSAGDERLLRAYDAILAVDPSNWDALRWKAFYARRLDRHDVALDCWTRLADNYPASRVPEQDLGAAMPGNQMEAASSPGNAYYLWEKGACLGALQRHDEAIAFLREAAQLSPNNTSMLRSLGDALCRTSKSSDALSFYDRILELEPGFDAVRFSRGVALVHLGRHQEALAALEEVERKCSMMLDPVQLIPYVRFKLGDHRAARRKLDELIGKYPYDRPLDDGGRSLKGVDVEVEYQTMVDEVFQAHANRRKG